MGIAALLVSATGCVSTKTRYSLADTTTPYGESYAIVISETTDADTGWHEVTNALLEKHPGATLVRHKERLDTPEGSEEVRTQLAKLMPLHTAFVTQPAECGRDIIAAIHRLTRKLDDDPWLDTRWGVITGATAADALRVAKATAPLAIRSALSTTALNSDLFEEHYLIRDTSPAGQWFWKKPRDPETAMRPDPETGNFKDSREDTAAFAQHFANNPDLIVTSFGGFENGVEMPFSRGLLRVWHDGRLYPFTDIRQIRPANDSPPLPDSASPKVYLPVRTCLAGHVNDANCLVTSMMGNYGVNQLAGYTVDTWFGRGGLGMLSLWQDYPGENTLGAAFFLNQQWMLHDLAEIDPDALNYKIQLGAGEVKIQHHLGDMLNSGLKFDPRNVLRNNKSPDHQLAGLLWDIDTLAFYGDPAWKATLRLPPGATPPYTAYLDSTNNHHTLHIKILNRAQLAQTKTPLGFIFGTRIENPRLLTGSEYNPMLADNFLLLLNPAPPATDDKITIEFEGAPLPHPPPSPSPPPRKIAASE
ncbi:MAG: hypothetical protein LBG65_05830 [Puniceicoccales bacterium]|nr:hypothetical protein [Puniceicoccales bacterium]